MERLIDRRLADRRGHVRIPSNDGGGDRADARARSICLCNAALFRDIPGKVATLNPRTRAGSEVCTNTREMETLVGGARSDWLGRGRSGRRNSYILDRITAKVRDDARTLFLVGRSHGDEDGQKRK